MNEPPTFSATEVDALIESICDAFERDWGQGRRPLIEQFLDRIPPGHRTNLLHELIHIDSEWRRKAGEFPTRDDYAGRFSEFASELEHIIRGQSERHDHLDPGVSTILEGVADVTGKTFAESNNLGQIGKYELLSEIARGGMGVVYKARQSGLNRIVALKMTLAGAFAGDEERRRFQFEAEAAGQLSHPGIVPIYEIGEHDGLPFFSMSFIEGPSLKVLLADGPLPPRRAAELLISIADAVEYAHSKGIVHRDLKPQNVLIDANGQPHITDFGLARQVATESDLTATGQVLGTPSFMPPEQAAGRISDIGPASDVYSMGATLYCLLTGRPPFQAANVMDTLKQVCETEPAPPRLINPEIDHDLQTICLKCLRKEPNQRYASAAELANDLQHFVKGEPIEARSLNLLERVAWTLERSRDVREFAKYSRLFFTFAVIVFSVEMLSYWVFLVRASVGIFVAVQSSRFVLFGLAIWRYRSEGLFPRNATERLLWSIWIGYVVACIADSTAYQLAHGWNVANASQDFPHLASITGLAFFAMGSVYWGWFYLFGIAFWTLAFVMQQQTEYAQPMFGIAWALALSAIGIYLRRLSRSTDSICEASQGTTFVRSRRKAPDGGSEKAR